MLRRARKQTATWKEYTDARKVYKETIKNCKKKATEDHLNKLKDIKNIGEAWTYINAKRKL